MTNLIIQVLRGIPFSKYARRDVGEELAKAAVKRNFQHGQIIFQKASIFEQTDRFPAELYRTTM